MKLTSRDIELLHFIGRFGFVDIEQILKRFHLQRRRGYQLLKRLVRHDYLRYERLFFRLPGIYRLTAAGGQLVDIAPLKQLPLSTYRHDLTVVNIYLSLRHQYDIFFSERELKVEKQHHDKSNKKHHLSDGDFLSANEKRIALEVELSPKRKQRVEKIMLGYMAQLHYESVLYYCHPNIYAYVKRIAEKMPLIKVLSLDEDLIYG